MAHLVASPPRRSGGARDPSTWLGVLAYASAGQRAAVGVGGGTRLHTLARTPTSKSAEQVSGVKWTAYRVGMARLHAPADASLAAAGLMRDGANAPRAAASRRHPARGNTGLTGAGVISRLQPCKTASGKGGIKITERCGDAAPCGRRRSWMALRRLRSRSGAAAHLGTRAVRHGGHHRQHRETACARATAGAVSALRRLSPRHAGVAHHRSRAAGGAGRMVRCCAAACGSIFVAQACRVAAATLAAALRLLSLIHSRILPRHNAKGRGQRQGRRGGWTAGGRRQQ